MNRQLPLDLPHRTAQGRDAFLVTSANAAAVAWIDRWPDWPGSALVLHGPPGSGKTHLASVWRARAGAGLVEGPFLDPEAVPALLDADRSLVVEAADDAPEASLLHLYNGIAERGLRLLLISAEPPSRWGIGLADLRSRLAALPVAAILAPDDRLIRAVLVKLFADRQQLNVSAELIDFIALRIERSFAAVQRAVAAIDAASLAAGKPIKIPLAERALREVGAIREEQGV
jgi:chromosomal replication initiation ATPase DnaA